MRLHFCYSPDPAGIRKNTLAAALFIALVAALFTLLGGVCPAAAQRSSDSQPSAGALSAPAQAPALVDPSGPPISLQNSEALFDIAAALNSCGYNQGLAASEPVRAQVRAEIDQALVASAEARDTHDRLCRFFDEHQLTDPGLSLAQYVSLALFLTPPPELTPSVENADLPPDSTQVEGVLPLVRKFSREVDLHLIWVRTRPQYDAELERLHNALNKMILDANSYLKMPANMYPGERFMVVIEPLLDPGQINARVYGSNYVVVASPSHGEIRMDEVRHTYLHFEIEPLLYARAVALDRLQPFLKLVQEAPIDFSYRSDVVPLVVECLIRAIEARTMDTGVSIYKIPADVRRSDLEEATRRHNLTVQEAEAARQKAVGLSMHQGFVLTRYFYNQLIAFEKEPESLKESIGKMVYGMDVGSELNRVKNIQFVSQASRDVVQREKSKPHGLDLAEIKLMKGDAEGAGNLAQESLKNGVDPGRANFILARAAILQSDIPSAKRDFEQTIALSKDPRMLAWSHIYLGRIYDVEHQRDQALAEYHAALTVRDGQPDTKQAAEKGLEQAYSVPEEVHTAPVDSDDDDSGNPAPAKTAAPREPENVAPSNSGQPR